MSFVNQLSIVLCLLVLVVQQEVLALTPTAAPTGTPTQGLLRISETVQRTSDTILTVNAALNVIASVLTFLLIWFMNRNGTLKLNAFIKCVVLMTLFQTLYDIGLLVIDGSDLILELNYIICTVIGGIGAAVWSLVILMIPIYHVIASQIPSPRLEMIVFVVVNLTIGSYAAYDWEVLIVQGGESHYEKVRIFLICCDCAAFFWLATIYFARIDSKTRRQNPLYHALRRMMFYPVIQVLTRLGAVFYNEANGTSELFKQPENPAVLLYLGALLLPTAGIGAFFLFLFMQKGAVVQLKRMICLDCALQSNESNEATAGVRAGAGTVEAAEGRQRRSSAKKSSFAHADEIPGGLSSMEEDLPEPYGIIDEIPGGDDEAYEFGRLTAMDEGELMQEYIENFSNKSAPSGGNQKNVRNSARGSTASNLEL
jgi:hypothetical protein